MQEETNRPIVPNAGAPASTPSQVMPPKEKSVGPVVGIIIIILVIILGGLYFWGERILKERGESIEMIENAPDTSLNSLQTQSSSDETAAIEADLEASALDSLEGDLGNIEAQFNE